MKQKSGFTLAESLVTLAIIGLIAMIMLPAIKNAQPNQEMVMFKKAYYNVSRIVSELINDEDFYPDPEDPDLSGFANAIPVEYHGHTFGGDSCSKFCGLFASKLNLANVSNPTTVCKKNWPNLSEGGNFKTIDGIAWQMPAGDFGAGDTKEFIFVDVNGPDKEPNCTRITASEIDNLSVDIPTCPEGKGPDIFGFKIYKNGSIEVLSKIGRLYATTSKVNKHYADFLREDSSIE